MNLVKRLIGERTSWDGAMLIGICGSAKMIAWVGLGYGIWTLVKKED